MQGRNNIRDFEVYKSNICHLVKDKGDMDFIIDILIQLSWLERTPDKREVGGSSPLKPIRRKRLRNSIVEVGSMAKLDKFWPMSMIAP